MRTNAPKRVVPSTIAASSSSRGTPSDEPAQRPDRERQDERQVHDDHAAQLVDLVERDIMM